MRAPLLIAMHMTMSFVHASKENAIDEVVADFVANLSELNGEGDAEVNYITDLRAFEEREVHCKLRSCLSQVNLDSNLDCGEIGPSWSASFPVRHSTSEPTIGEMEKKEVSHIRSWS